MKTATAPQVRCACGAALPSKYALKAHKRHCDGQSTTTTVAPKSAALPPIEYVMARIVSEATGVKPPKVATTQEIAALGERFRIKSRR